MEEEDPQQVENTDTNTDTDTNTTTTAPTVRKGKRMETKPKLVTFQCQHCRKVHAVSEPLTKVDTFTVSHACPKNGGKATRFIQVTRVRDPHASQ